MTATLAAKKNMFVRYLFLSQPRKMGLIILISVLAAVLEGVGLSMFFPLFQETAAGLTASVPTFLRNYINFFNQFELPLRMQIIAGILIGIVFVKLLVIRWNTSLILRLRNDVVRYYRMEAVQALLATGLSRFNKKKISDLNLLIDGLIDQHLAAIVDLVGTTMQYLFTLIFLLIVLFCLSWKMTLVAVLVVGAGAWALSGITAVIHRYSTVMVETKGVFNQALFDVLHGLKVIRLFSREKMMIETFDAAVMNSNRAYSRAMLWSNMVGPVFEFIGAFILGAILFAGAFLVAKGGITLGVILTFLVILVRIIPSFKALNHARGSIVARLPSLKIVEDLIREKGDDVPDGKEAFLGLRQGIEIRDLCFRYDAGSPLVLNHLSLTIPRGTRLGIVGASGAGKSTFLELLLRFYDPESGAIFVDGKDLRDFSRSSWLNKIGVVSQDPFLFNDTVRANIAFAKPGVSDAQIESAARRAYAHDFIMALPGKYDTVIGERGALISGGQRQRIAIARAILRDPDIFLFDEATSALDAESEACVQKAINEISHAKTVITIAHRLSTLTGSDRIIVFEKGGVLQQGRHDELMREDGPYRRFVETQAL